MKTPITVITACGRNESAAVRAAYTDSVVALRRERLVSWVIALDAGVRPWPAPARFLPSDGWAGLAASRNRALAAAGHGLVVCLDSDDVLLPTVEDLADMVAARGLRYGAGQAIDIGEDGQWVADPIEVVGPSRDLQPGEPWRLAKQTGVFPWRCCGSMVMDRDLMLAARGYCTDPAVGVSDDVTMAAAATSDAPGLWWATPVSCYRKHPGQRTSSRGVIRTDEWPAVDRVLPGRARCGRPIMLADRPPVWSDDGLLGPTESFVRRC